MKTLVTMKSNIESIDDEQNISLKDPKAVGYLVKTHPLMAQSQDPATGKLNIGFVFRAEVYWDNHRSPAPCMEDPEELFWLAMDYDENSEEVDEEEESDEDFDDNNDFAS